MTSYQHIYLLFYLGRAQRGACFTLPPLPNLIFGEGNFFLVYIKKILKLKIKKYIKKVIKVTLGYISIREHFYMYDYKKSLHIIPLLRIRGAKYRKKEIKNSPQIMLTPLQSPKNLVHVTVLYDHKFVRWQHKHLSAHGGRQEQPNVGRQLDVQATNYMEAPMLYVG